MTSPILEEGTEITPTPTAPAAPARPRPDSPFQRIVAVTNREPFRMVEREGTARIERTAGGLVSALEPVMRAHRGVWLSAAPATIPDVRAVSEALSYDWVPVEVPEEQNSGFYEHISNRALWPLYHSMPGTAAYEPKYWDDYQQVNARFAEQARASVRPGDLVWIHDYQLSLMPGLMRREPLPPEVLVGFFLHIPFPGFDLFRTLPWAEEILRGMLGASLIGFHVAEYCRNFFDCVEQLLDIRCDRLEGCLHYEGRVVHVRSIPISIDTEGMHRDVARPEVGRMAEELRAQVGCEKLIVGVDRLDYTKGILERLRALEVFFREQPEWRGRVSLIQLAVPSRAGIAEYRQLREDIERQIGRINGLYAQPGWTPVTYMRRSLPYEELLALYLASDVALVTPLRDGMNLVAKEYVAAHRYRPGVLILSELAGAARQLSEALLVNPYDIRAVAGALKRALEMDEGEQRRQMRTMNTKIRRYDVHHWVNSFIDEAAYVP